MDLDAALSHLQARLRRLPAERYPVQHATTQFHLGVALIESGRADEAVPALRRAAELFGPAQLKVERAKALNMLGVALRESMRPDEAADAFAESAQAFRDGGQQLEEAAALYNLGLVQRGRADVDGAVACFRQALHTFEASGQGSQAAAAARELGAALLTAGDAQQAVEVLTRATELADRAGDARGLSDAANTLGLALLATAAARPAVDAFQRALAHSPRSLRPQAYAMAQANLALALARTGELPRARLAARQALGVPQVPQPVVTQATELLDGLDQHSGDLAAVLDADPRERWPETVRAEVLRWVDAEERERRAALREWIEAQQARAGMGSDLAEALLGVLLEQPPAAMQRLLRSLLLEVGEQDVSFRADVSHALSRFPMPQWLRLRSELNRIAVELGEEPAWE